MSHTSTFDFDLNCTILRYIVPFNYELYDFKDENIKVNNNHGTSKTSNNASVRSWDSIKDLYDNVVQKLTVSSKWKKQMSLTDENDIYTYVLNSLFRDKIINSEEYNIGSCWEYLNEEEVRLRWNYHSSKFATSNKIFVEDWKNTEFSIEKCGLYIFKTGVGFFWYEIKCDNLKSADKLIEFQSHFKELAAYWQTKEFLRIKPLENSMPEQFIMGQWVASVIEDTIGKVNYYPSRKNPFLRNEPTNKTLFDKNLGEIKQYSGEIIENIPDKAILYTYAALCEDNVNPKIITDNSNSMYGLFGGNSSNKSSNQRIITPELMDNLVFHLTCGYSSKIHITENFHKNLLIPSGNTCWFASESGCGQFAYCDVQDGGFMLDQNRGMSVRMRNDYFFLYLLLLYQHYSLISFSERLELTFPTNVSTVAYDAIQNHLSSINFFIVKSMHSSVSHLEQHNAFYRYVNKSLNIRENIERLSIGLESLESITRELSHDEDSKRTQKMQRTLAFFSLLVITSSLTDLYSVLDENIPDLYKELWEASSWLQVLFGPEIFDTVYYSIGKLLLAGTFFCVFLYSAYHWLIAGKKK